MQFVNAETSLDQEVITRILLPKFNGGDAALWLSTDAVTVSEDGNLQLRLSDDGVFAQYRVQLDDCTPLLLTQASALAYQTVLLDIKNGDHVLEIGTGSGYQAAVLAALGAKVFTVERQEALYLQTKKLLADMGFSTVKCFFRDGSKGLPEKAPFDKIIVTAGAPVIPEPLVKQLSIGGILVIPVGESVQKMLKITRLSATEFKQEHLGDFRFVPFLEGVSRNSGPK